MHTPLSVFWLTHFQKPNLNALPPRIHVADLNRTLCKSLRGALAKHGMLKERGILDRLPAACVCLRASGLLGVWRGNTHCGMAHYCVCKTAKLIKPSGEDDGRKPPRGPEEGSWGRKRSRGSVEEEELPLGCASVARRHPPVCARPADALRCLIGFIRPLHFLTYSTWNCCHLWPDSCCLHIN